MAPPFVFEPPPQPYTNTIGELMVRAGDVQAQGIRQNGAIWGNAIQGIGQQVGAIPQQMAQQRNDAMKNAMLQQEMQMRDQAMRKSALEAQSLDHVSRLLGDPQSKNDDGTFNIDYIVGKASKDPIIQLPHLTAALKDTDLIRGEQQKVQADKSERVADLGANMIRNFHGLQARTSGEPTPDDFDRTMEESLAQGSRMGFTDADINKFREEIGDPKNAFGWAVAQAENSPSKRHLKLTEDKITGNNGAITSVFGKTTIPNPGAGAAAKPPELWGVRGPDGVVVNTPVKWDGKTMVRVSDGQDVTKDIVGKGPEGKNPPNLELKSVTMDGVPGIPVFVNTDPTATVRFYDKNSAAIDTAKHDIKMPETMASVQRDAGSLSEDALNQAARSWHETGKAPEGYGTAGSLIKKQVLERMVKNYGSSAMGLITADFAANKAALTKNVGTETALGAFENGAKANLEMFAQLSAKLPNVPIPVLNTPLRLIDDKMIGDEWMPAINKAREIAGREVTRITTDPALRGHLTDAGAAAAKALISDSLTLAQFQKLMPVLLNDIYNVHKGVYDEGQEIRNMLAGHPGAPPAPPPPIPGLTPAATPPAAAPGVTPPAGAQNVQPPPAAAAQYKEGDRASVATNGAVVPAGTPGSTAAVWACVNGKCQFYATK